MFNQAKQPPTGRCRSVVAHCVLPLMAGAAIYVLWRDSSLILFDWLSACGLSGAVDVSRVSLGAPLSILPHWFLYNLPDGLWAYGLTSSLCIVWSGRDGTAKLLWLSAVPVLAIGSEFGQFYSVLPGTFEFGDVVSYAIGFLAAIVVFRHQGEWSQCEESTQAPSQNPVAARENAHKPVESTPVRGF